jgi:HK97 family phage major capsid protein
LAEGFIKDGKSPDDFRRAVLDEMDRPKVTRVPDNAAEIGMSEKEVKRYSLIRAINAMVSKDWSKAGLELEASRAVGQKLGKEAQGFFLPFEVQMKNFNLGHLQRDLTVGTTTAGGHTVATNLLAGSFIELLRNKMVTLGLGAQMLSGLIGNIAIPRATGGATAYWVSEGSAPTESQQAFDQVTMSPKTVGAFTDISRKLLLQSSIDIDSFVMNDLSTILAIEIDRVGINGSASGAEPRGILNTSGIGAVVGGTHGAAPDEADIIDLETEVAIDNALLGTLAYLTNTKVRGKLKKTPIAAEHPDKVWDSRSPQTPLNGYRAEVTNQVPSNLTKGDADGVCSAIIFGNFNDLIYGQWGGLDIMQDPYTSSTTGTVRIVALQDVDVAVRHPQSFAAMKDALTA